MTDNEKRAHDLAIAMLPSTIEYQSEKAVENGTAENGVNLFECYMSTYKSALNEFNREFPDGK